MVFVQAMEQWTSSTPSAGSLRVHGSLPNQSICALWTWRRHSTVSCGGFSGTTGYQIWAVRSLYDRCQSMVRIASNKSDLFPVRVGLRQGCPLSPILFIIFMDRISRHSQGVQGVRFCDLRIGSLLFADDVVLLASSDRDLQLSLDRFAAECEAAGMRISTSKSKSMVLNWKRVECTDEILPQVEEPTSTLGSCLRVRGGWSGRSTGGSVQRLQECGLCMDPSW